MPLSPALLIHIMAANVGLISGYLSMVLRKGSGLHRAAGTVFTISMLAMSTSAVYIATVVHPIRINVVVGLLTFYLVSTAWWAGKRREGTTSGVDVTAFVFIAGVTLLGITSAFEAAGSATGRKDGIPAAIYFVFGSIALLCATNDMRMLLRRKLEGAQRLKRHLWRMSLALLIATVSLYPGNAKLFPVWLRQTKVLLLPHLLLVGAMIYWMIRMSRRRKAQRAAVIRANEVALPAPAA